MIKKNVILVTGATGSLGGELVKRFLFTGYETVILIRPDDKGSINAKVKHLFFRIGYGQPFPTLQLENLKVVEGDITAPGLGMPAEQYKELSEEIDEVFHCAASIKFTGVSRDDLINCNHKGTENVLQFCLSGKKKHIHHISTAYVAGRKKGIAYENEIDESYGFNNSYEESKFLAEKSVHNFASKQGLDFTIYRPSIIIGDSKTGYTRNFDGLYIFIKTIISLKNRLDFSVGEGNIKQIRARIPGSAHTTVNLVPIDYVINAIMSIFFDRNRSGKTFHIINPNPPSLSHILEIIMEVLQVTGLKFIGYDKIKREEMSPLERIIWKRLEKYGGYMHNATYFQSKNALSILNDFCVTCPKMTKSLMSTLINFAVQNEWRDESANTDHSYQNYTNFG